MVVLLMNEVEAAVAIVHARGAEESVLLMRRSERAEDSWSGHWAFPGGRRDPADADLLHTALRELEEECGLRLARSDLETEMPPRIARRRAGPHLLVAPFIFRVDRELAVIPDGKEAAAVMWVPLSLLRNPGNHHLLPIPGAPEARYPSIELPRAPLWGFTYRLICDWLGMNPDTTAT